MKKINIARGGVSAVVLPDFGGMVSELAVGNVDVLRMDYAMLGMANVLSGGIPVLFPFVSRCKDDEAVFRGKTCTMPMHGFAKDMSFEVVRAWESGCEIRLESSPATLSLYPYEFLLTLVYEIEDHALRTTMRVENRSEVPMPFAAGYHPYFLTPDRSQTTFRFGLTEFWDYTKPDKAGNPAHGFLNGALRLADMHDTVFWNGCADSQIESIEMGYRAKIKCGETFGVITVCTALKDASCVEPWQARPGAAHRQEDCQMLEPGAVGEYLYSIDVSKIKKENDEYTLI